MINQNYIKLYFVFSLFLLTIAGCGSDADFAQQYPKVTYLVLKASPQQITTELHGRTTAFEIAEIRPQVGGIIQSRLFVEGGKVNQGDVLYQIDPALFEAAVNSAQATLLQAKASAHSTGLLASRYSKLLGSQAVSRQEYDNALASSKEALATVEAAKAALNTAEINLSYTKVTSPIAGIIGKSTVTSGALVTAGQPTPLATVQQLSPMYVDVTQSSADFLRLKKSVFDGELSENKLEGAPATLILSDGTEYPEEGELLFSEVTIDAGTGSYVIRAQFPNAQSELMQNLFVRLRIATAKSDKAILIPQRTVTRNAKGMAQVKILVPKVFAENEKAPTLSDPSMALYSVEIRDITLAQAIENQWIVTGGINPGERLLLEGAINVQANINTVIGTLHADAPVESAQ